MKEKYKIKNKEWVQLLKNPFSLFIFLILIIYTLSLMIPLFWAFTTSFKSKHDFILNTMGLPDKWLVSNYYTVFNELYISRVTTSGIIKVYTFQLLINAMLYTIGSTLVNTFSRCIAAYAAARYNKYFITRLLYPIVIITMLLPIVGSLPAELKLFRAIGVYDNIFGVIFMKGGFLGTNFLIFYATFKGISWEYAEAAFIDGASHFKVLTRIMIPLAKSTVSALMILSFITFWNDWSINVVYLPNFPMISYALYQFQNQTITSISTIPHKLAASMFVTLPMLFVFIIFRNKIMGNVSMGGLKG